MFTKRLRFFFKRYEFYDWSVFVILTYEDMIKVFQKCCSKCVTKTKLMKTLYQHVIFYFCEILAWTKFQKEYKKNQCIADTCTYVLKGIDISLKGDSSKYLSN